VMGKQVLIAVLILIALLLAFSLGRLRANLWAYYKGVEHGYSNGVSDAYISYKTSGIDRVKNLLDEADARQQRGGN